MINSKTRNKLVQANTKQLISNCQDKRSICITRPCFIQAEERWNWQQTCCSFDSIG